MSYVAVQTDQLRHITLHQGLVSHAIKAHGLTVGPERLTVHGYPGVCSLGIVQQAAKHRFY